MSVQFSRSAVDSAAETLTIVRFDSGAEYYSEALDGLSPFVVEVTTDDDLIGVYDLDGDKIDTSGETWEAAQTRDVPASVIEAVQEGWATGPNFVTRKGAS